jgi:uncharacterized protein YjiK
VTASRGAKRSVRARRTRTPNAGRYAALVVASALLASIASLPAGVSAQATPHLVISEVHSAGNNNGTYAADWFEVTNTGTTAVDITGWRVDDNSSAFATGLALRGVTSIPPGKSAVFFEGVTDGSTDAAIGAAFLTAWFGAAPPPAGFLLGSYGGSAIGFGGSGDSVNLFDANENRVTGVSFGAASAAVPVATFDNTAGVGSTTLPLPNVGTFSAAGINGAFVSANGAEVGSPGVRITASPLSGVDLSTYVRIGRFDLPEPTRTTAPPNSVLAQEASAVTYNWDTDTLFIVGDRGSSIVQVSKTGQLIDSMTLAIGSSPQGTEFYDTEGLTYVGGGMFVLVEERDRQAVLFAYAAGTTLTRGDTRTVKLGTTIDNTGLEGITYDPATSGFIAVKEITPQAIFQTGIDFLAGTATNGSPTTVNSTNLFDPTVLGLLDIADVYGLSNLPSLSGPEASHVLMLSQESGMIVNVDRTGVISSALAITPDPGEQPVADQGHEGLTMDGNGVLYLVAENGGGDINHPQLWVYAPSLAPNQPPTSVALSSPTTSLAENTSTALRLKVAGIAITDDGLGTNTLQVSGVDAGAFEVDSTGLYIKAGTVLDFETKTSYSVTVEVDDTSVGATPDATVAYALSITDVVIETPPVPASLAITEVASWASGNAPYAADWFEVTNTGATPVDITGWRFDDESGAFATGATLTGVTTIAPGKSVIFIDSSDPATTIAAFTTAWFGASPPADLQIGTYTGSGLGLSTSGDFVNLFDASGNRVTGVSVGASTTGFTFDNAAGVGSSTPPLPTISTLSVVGVNGAFLAADSVETGSPGTIVGGPVVPRVIISEVTPWSSGNAPYAADWFEVTNIGTSPVDLTGWTMDDNSNGTAKVALSGVTTIARGQSAIFIETTDLPGTRAAFLTAWFGASPSEDLQVGSYSGSGVSLSTSGDSVNLFDASGALIAGVSFGASTTGFTFDNAAGAGSSTLPLPTISTLSVVGVSGAFLAANGAETGSPGRIANPIVLPSLVITEVTPWASGNAPYAADWFEVTNIGNSPVDITGFKMDDESGSGFPLNGITTIAAGESVIFIETADLAAAKAAFSSAWFGANPPASLQIGGYSGSGVSLSTGGDAVNLFDASGHRVTGVSFGASTTGFTFDNAAGVGGTALPLPTISALSVVGVNGAFLAADGSESGSPGRIADVTPPVIDPVSDLMVEATGPTGAVVSYTAPATLDDIDGAGVATCAPVSGSAFPVGVTTVTCTSTDAAGNTGTTTFTVTVRVTATPDGRIYGIGQIKDGGKHHHFAFSVSEIGARDYARFEYWVSPRHGRFEATSITSVVFSNDPAFRPGRSFFFRPPTVDSVTFSGAGKWNGQAGYAFSVTATDQGEPGRRRDTFTLIIKDANGKIVASVDDEIDGGNIQSTRLRALSWFF